MGNCCGKTSSSSGTSSAKPFASPGRTLNETPPARPVGTSPQADTASSTQGGRWGWGGSSSGSPQKAPPKIASFSRTLGGGQSADGGAGGEGSSSTAAGDAAKDREIRAAALDKRLAENAPKGKLGRGLAETKKQTRVGTLESVSQAERQTREADEATRNLQHN